MVAPKRRGNPALRFAAVRRIHTYLGLLIAPSVLFFALTGAVQIYKLHEAHEGYVPPPVVEKLGMVHKIQVYKARGKRPGPPAAEAAKVTAAPAAAKPAEAKAPATKPKLATTLLKAIFLLVSIALAAATVLGAWMAVAYGREKRLSWILLGVGTVIPTVLIALST
ncbi:hypothetical protein [Caulobacter segnis]|uniref:hypothetical protein n=1 Tax=Caulobacter segnis TaxID=88688 RepID=UPI00285674A5|nr:hypothetical protein [Caulobacter segnis]MDR6624107.1 hypothetical protein [Caulobacter segnis]